MMTITALSEKELEVASREFFAMEFQTKRLGSGGHWLGPSAQALKLACPVSSAEFKNLAHGLTPHGSERALPEQGSPEHTSAWQIRFDASQSLSVLWALAPERSRHAIEAAHLMAIGASFRALEELLTPPKQERTGLLYVLFESGASHDQSPHRCANVFLFKQAISGTPPAHKFISIDIEQHKAALKWHYEGALDYFLFKEIGPFQRVPGCDELRIVGVPQELVRRFFFDPPFITQGNGNERTLIPQEFLFDRWHARAEQWGWGPKQANDLLELLHYKALLNTVKCSLLDNLQRNIDNFERGWNSVKRALGFIRPAGNNPEHSNDRDHDRSR